LNLPGMDFEPVSFKPESSKYKGRICNGVRIIISERDRLEPYFSGIRIIDEIYRMYPQDFQWREKHFDRLCGTSKIRDAITNHLSLNDLRKKWQLELKSFQKIRKKYLIYPD
jgi:beta-N-acetylhexosaminidase